ncbi:MAG: hypothetical protein ACU826_12285 [Gammaproteobacteria bacterium]
MKYIYDQKSYEDLRQRIQYESWLLEAVYEISGVPILEEWPDQVIYPANGSALKRSYFMHGTCVIGDWRPQFLKAGAPLIFVTSFKLIDMLIEWILERNGKDAGYRFSKKIENLENGLAFPPFFNRRNGFKHRLIGFYKNLEPLRGTIIHDRHFKTTDGDLHVSSSKANKIGPEVVIKAEELRKIAILTVSILRYVEGSWKMSPYKEKLLRRMFDEIKHLHKFSSLRQKRPWHLTIRVFAKISDSIQVDLDRIRHDIAEMCPNQDAVFDLRIVAVNADGSNALGYLFPWEEIRGVSGNFSRPVTEINRFLSQLPDDIDITQIAKELNGGME